MLGVRLDEQLENRLNELATKTRRSKSFIAKEALLRYLDEEERKQIENELTLARWQEYQETGEVVAHSDVIDWLDSWGSDQESLCPSK